MVNVEETFLTGIISKNWAVTVFIENYGNKIRGANLISVLASGSPLNSHVMSAPLKRSSSSTSDFVFLADLLSWLYNRRPAYHSRITQLHWIARISTTEPLTVTALVVTELLVPVVDMLSQLALQVEARLGSCHPGCFDAIPATCLILARLQLLQSLVRL